MSEQTMTAFFLWVGSDLPDIARISVLSAAEAGFDTVLFTDRPQKLDHSKLRIADWREIDLPWEPEDVRLKGEDKPCYAAFSDLFRFTLLSQNDGWWFDCDTVIMRPAVDFAKLMQVGKIVVGKEDDQIINGAVLGSSDVSQMKILESVALVNFPVLDRWGIVGPALITDMIARGHIEANVVEKELFYPVHHNTIANVYLPEHRENLLQQEKNWYCLSLWGEVLSRSGLKYLSPPNRSYLADLLERHPAFGPISGDAAAMAAYLSDNLSRLEEMDSGRLALQTLRRKVTARLPIGRKQK